MAMTNWQYIEFCHRNAHELERKMREQLPADPMVQMAFAQTRDAYMQVLLAYEKELLGLDFPTGPKA